MSDHVYKSSEIVGLSITEILLIIIFGLVLVAQIFSSQLGEARDSAGSVEQELLASGQEAQAVMKVVDELNELMGNPPVEWEGLPDLAAQLDAAKGELSTLRDDMSSLIVAADLPGASLPEVWTTLVRAAKAVDDTQGGLIELVSQVEALKVENEALAEDNKSLRKNLTEVNDQLTDLRVMLEAAGVDSVESLAEANEDLEARVGNLTNEVRGLRNELNRVGFGHQPCWSDEVGRIEFLMRVEIGEGRLVSAPIFPSNRAEDLVELPVQESDLRREFTLQQFTNSFLPLYRWSKTEGGDCRFFVEIIDKDSETKDGYKAARSTIENLFFIRNLD